MKQFLLSGLLMIAFAAHAGAKVRYAGGDGSSMSNAVVILGAANGFEGVRSEYKWLAKNKPTCRRGSQSLINRGKKVYDVLTIRCGSKKVEVYFDITNFFGKY